MREGSQRTYCECIRAVLERRVLRLRSGAALSVVEVTTRPERVHPSEGHAQKIDTRLLKGYTQNKKRAASLQKRPEAI
jgi:hypothetical protein